MKLIRGYNPFKHKINTVVTIGNFDGVHLGHQKLMTELKQVSEKLALPSVILTFEPHPQEFFAHEKPVSRIMRLREKWMTLLRYKIDYLYCLKFNKKLANLFAEEFVEKILVQALHAKKIIIGEDFKFGFKRLGDLHLLKKMGDQFGFSVIILPKENYQDEKISSSRVRDALKIGDFKKAQLLTGRPFFLSGKIIHGEKIGKNLGFPTANILLHPMLSFLEGVFVVRVLGIGSKIIYGVASIGYRSTFDIHHNKLLLEVYLFDFNQMIYGKNITVEFLKKIRDQIRFNAIDDLVAQIKIDVAIAKNTLSRI
ncbi:MAG: riboflavin biosynthesis protein RibF [uncultured bacterium]|nr:MAG: riboflavin biosynthesis protein RibF [uncultured bacterium]